MKFSLKMKATLLIASLGLLISIMAILIYGEGIHEIIRTQYAERSIDIANTVAVELEKERVLRLRDAVKGIYESTENVVLSDQWGTPESLQPWDRISDAIGCAVYIPGRDRNVDDVFNRADELMYENKKTMKKTGEPV